MLIVNVDPQKTNTITTSSGLSNGFINTVVKFVPKKN
jgi:hypothetical protein